MCLVINHVSKPPYTRVQIWDNAYIGSKYFTISNKTLKPLHMYGRKYNYKWTQTNTWENGEKVNLLKAIENNRLQGVQVYNGIRDIPIQMNLGYHITENIKNNYISFDNILVIYYEFNQQLLGSYTDLTVSTFFLLEPIRYKKLVRELLENKTIIICNSSTTDLAREKEIDNYLKNYKQIFNNLWKKAK